MHVLEWADFMSRPQEAAAMTIGVFDGLHRGHEALIKAVVERGPMPTVLTFKQNPKGVLHPQSHSGDIYSLKQKLEGIEALGVSRVILIDFSSDFCKLGGSDFLDMLIHRGNMVFLAVGKNFRCGYQVDTDAQRIKSHCAQKGVPVAIFHPLKEGTGPVSSSRIRAAIAAGDLRQAVALLGRPVSVDLGDVPMARLPDGFYFETAAKKRLVPRQGRFLAAAYGIYKTIVTDIVTERGDIFLPVPDAAIGNVQGLRFVCP